MFDFELQMRFWRGMTDAMLHGTQASLAAASAWQDQVLATSEKVAAASKSASNTFVKAGQDLRPTASSAHSAKTPAATSPLLWWLAPWQAVASAFSPPQTTLCNPFAAKPAMPANPFFDMMPWFQMFWRPQQSAALQVPGWPVISPATMLNAWGSSPSTAIAGPLGALWPWSAMTWGYMQTPMTAMLMSAGMPYAVAAPSAKASTAAMDAAHAARQQMDKMYSAYRSDGGHAAAQIAILPWSIAAAFLETSPAQNEVAATRTGTAFTKKAAS